MKTQMNKEPFRPDARLADRRMVKKDLALLKECDKPELGEKKRDLLGSLWWALYFHIDYCEMNESYARTMGYPALACEQRLLITLEVLSETVSELRGTVSDDMPYEQREALEAEMEAATRLIERLAKQYPVADCDRLVRVFAKLDPQAAEDEQDSD